MIAPQGHEHKAYDVTGPEPFSVAEMVSTSQASAGEVRGSTRTGGIGRHSAVAVSSSRSALAHIETLGKDRSMPLTSRTAPRFIQPMAARVVDKLPEGHDWMYEVKFDGYRALLLKEGDNVRIRSRNDKDLTNAYPSVASAARRLNTTQRSSTVKSLPLIYGEQTVM
jgi:ATP-dependent DNA ligase